MATPVESDAFVQGASKAPVSKWQSFLTFLYNSKEGTVLGRTGKSWLQITVFYIIFYGVLAAFFAVLLMLFLQTLDPNEPKWQGASGIIGSTPGLGFRPIPPDSGSTLIWVKAHGTDATGNSTSQGYVDGLNTFLNAYEKSEPEQADYMTCNVNTKLEKGGKKTCRYPLEKLGNCHREKNNYGYTVGQPCVALKLNRIYDWSPQPYEAGDSDLPAEVRNFYEKLVPPGLPTEQDQIYITCTGEDPVDQEHIGKLSLYPRSIDKFYFPFLNQDGYLSPVVMVQFLNPSHGVLINVECKAWARNIKHSRIERLGQVHFEILVDP